MIFKVKNTAVELHFRFAAVLTFLLLLFPNGNASDCFLLCVLHESGHLAALYFFKSPPLGIKFDFFGMKIETSKKLLSPAREIICAAAGPLINLVAAALLHFFKYSDSALLSLGLALFNLLPVSVLDGGRILAVLIKDDKILRVTGFLTAAVLLIIGTAVAVYTERNFTILVVALYLLFGMFVKV